MKDILLVFKLKFLEINKYNQLWLYIIFILMMILSLKKKVEGFNSEELSIYAMQHKDSWELQLEFLKEYEDKYDGLILDLKLDDLPNDNNIRAKFRGTSIAQEIRTRQKKEY